MDQPPAVAFTAFADVWPRAIETEIGTALCTIGRGKDFDFFSLFDQIRFLKGCQSIVSIGLQGHLLGEK